MFRFDILKASRDSIRRHRSEARRRGLRTALRPEPLEGRRLLTVYFVTSTSGSELVSGSLPCEVALANADLDPAGSSIGFNLPGTRPQTITLDQPLTLSKPGLEEIFGPTTGGVTISGNHQVEVFSIGQNTAADLFNLTIANGSATTGGGIENKGQLSLDNCTITGNTATDGGGGIRNERVLSVVGSTIEDNTVGNRYGSGDGAGIEDTNTGVVIITSSSIKGNVGTGPGTMGGGLFSAGGTTISNSTIEGNSAGWGGGIRAEGYASGSTLYGYLKVQNSSITGNKATSISGGGVFAEDCTSTLTGCTITGNSAALFGGGVLESNGSMTIAASTIQSNVAQVGGGGVDNYLGPGFQVSSLTINQCTVAGNSAGDGGGVRNQGATLTINASTISGNRATGGVISTKGLGAGLELAPAPSLPATKATVLVSDSTFANNTAVQGGGIYNGRDALVAVSDTIADNTATAAGGGGGLDAAVGSTLLADTIVALNTAGATHAAGDIAGTVASSSSYNLVGTGGTGGLTNGTNHNQVGVNPELSAPGSYGGPTQTMALLKGSPAIAAGSSSIAGVTVPTVDQRGVARPSNGVDVGAYQALAGTTVTLPGTSKTGAAPAAISFNGNTVVAWTGTDDDIHVESSSDGVHFGNEVTLTPPSNVAPALDVFDGRLYIAWTGMKSALNIESSSDGVHFGNEVTLAYQASRLAPTLATFGGKLYAGWTSPTGLIKVESSSDGVHFGSVVTLTNATTDCSPTLDAFNSKLYVAWTGTNDYLNLESSSDGVNFGGLVTIAETTYFAPALTNYDGSLVIGWTGIAGRVSVESSSDGVHFGNWVRLNTLSGAAPSLAVFDDALAAVWTGKDGSLNLDYLWAS